MQKIYDILKLRTTIPRITRASRTQTNPLYAIWEVFSLDGGIEQQKSLKYQCTLFDTSSSRHAQQFLPFYIRLRSKTKSPTSFWSLSQIKILDLFVVDLDDRSTEFCIFVTIYKTNICFTKSLLTHWPPVRVPTLA